MMDGFPVLGTEKGNFCILEPRKSTRSSTASAAFESKPETVAVEGDPVDLGLDSVEKSATDSDSAADNSVSDSASDKENTSVVRKDSGSCASESVMVDPEPSSGFSDGVEVSVEEEGSEDGSSCPSPVPEGQYEVEKIIDYGKDGKGHLYHVKWKNWGEEHNTWEPQNNLLQCEEALIAFFLERREEIDKILSKSDYVETSDGKRRRKGPPLKLLPPDPRPVSMIAQEFYETHEEPNEEEIRKCETEWKQKWAKEQKSKTAKAKSPQTSSFVWQLQKITKVLQDGINGKLSDAEIATLRKQLLFYEFERKKALSVEALKDWENEINDISEGNPVIKVENNVDLEGPPSRFIYINDYVPGPGIKIPDDPPVGCACEGSCYENRGACCAQQSGFPFAYTPYGKLKLPVGSAIYECNKKCTCGPDCPNRVVQHGCKTLRLAIYRTSNMGWGVKTLKNIKKGQFVSLYVGEVIRTEEAERRGRHYDADGCTYLFDLDFNEGDCPYTVDAASYGNIAHFINHSCDPNLAVFPVWINCLDPNLPKLALFAMKDIGHGEELFFDYKSDAYKDKDSKVPNSSASGAGSPTKASTSAQKPQTERKLCLCGASNCKKFLF